MSTPYEAKDLANFAAGLMRQIERLEAELITFRELAPLPQGTAVMWNGRVGNVVGYLARVRDAATDRDVIVAHEELTRLRVDDPAVDG